MSLPCKVRGPNPLPLRGQRSYKKGVIIVAGRRHSISSQESPLLVREESISSLRAAVRCECLRVARFVSQRSHGRIRSAWKQDAGHTTLTFDATLERTGKWLCDGCQRLIESIRHEVCVVGG